MSTLAADPRVKARGVLLGAALGDALGAPYEGLPLPAGPDFNAVLEARGPLRYTDDTAMTIALAECLVEAGDLDEDQLAASFARRWEAEPWRGYGRGTFHLLRAISEGGDWRAGASGQFGGEGSWGNGAAMRVSPVVLAAGDDLTRMLDLARRSARVTHAHPLGVDGAALQAGAVALALQTPVDIPLNRRVFLARLRGFVAESAMADQITALESLDDDCRPADVAARIGSGIDACSSVPAAIAAALTAGSSFVEGFRFAISIGGDTDTIGSMTGAIVGAHLGAEAIPQALVRRLEDRERLVALADALVGLNASLSHKVRPQ